MTNASEITGLLVVVVSLSILPFVAMVITSYAKLVVIMGLLRNALGVQQIPPNMVLNGIAIIITVYVMAPIGFAATDRLRASSPGGDVSHAVLELFEGAHGPYVEFLNAHINPREKNFFIRSTSLLWPKSVADRVGENDLIILAPSFAITQLTEAFKIGFCLYIAFTAVDLIIANVLLAMGLNQVQSTNVAIPFKILLFVVMDGWSTLIHGLVMSYK